MEVFLQGKGLLKLTQMKGLVIYALYYEIESWSQMRADLHMEARTVAKDFRSKLNQTG